MRKKWILFALAAMLTLCLSVTTALADTPEDMTLPQVTEKMDRLAAQLDGKYFTTDRKNAYSNAAETCNMSNVVRTGWLAEETDGMVPDSLFASGTFVHYYNGTTLTRGYSCCGFANYALWYVFAQDSADIVKSKEIAFVSFNKANLLKYAQPGDVLRLGDYSGGGGAHSVLLYSIDDNGITVIDSNWGYSYDMCKVNKHTIKYSSYNYAGITRAVSYEYPTGWYTVEDDLRQRSGPSVDDSIRQITPDGTKVRIIDTVDNWGKYEYNGITGWSNMDYMRFSGTYVNTVTLNDGSGSVQAEYFNAGTGYTFPAKAPEKAGYRFLGWTLEHEDLDKVRYVSADGNTYQWMTEAQAAAQGYTKYLYTAGDSYERSAGIDRAASYRAVAQWEDAGFPVQITTNAATGKPVLKWDAVKGAEKYEIWRSGTYSGTYTKYYTTTSTTFTNSAVKTGQKYYYKVVAVGAKVDANSANSKTVTIVCDLPQPTGVSISTNAVTGKPVLKWNAVAGAVGYEIWRSGTYGGTYTKYYTTTATTFTNSAVKAGQKYYYKVVALGATANANSAASKIVTVVCDCAQPAVTITTNASTGKPVLKWDAVEGAVKYDIYRSATYGGTYTKYYTTTSTSFTNNSVKTGQKYYYKVVALGATAAADSTVSKTVTIVCDCQKVDASISLNSSGKPVVKWDAVDGATFYEVYRCGTRNGTYTLYTTTKYTQFTNSGVSAGQQYFYKVRAIVSGNSSATGAFSDIVTVKAK